MSAALTERACARHGPAGLIFFKSLGIAKLPDGSQIGDEKLPVAEGKPRGPLERIGIDAARLGLAVPVLILKAQHFAQMRLGHENRPVGRGNHEPGMIEPFGKKRRFKAFRHAQAGPGGTVDDDGPV